MHRTQLSTLAWLAFTTLTHLGTATPTPDVASYAIVERSGSQDSSYNSGSSSGGDSGAGTSSYGGSSYSSGSSSGGNTGAGDSSYGGGSSPYNPDSSNKGNSGYGMPNYGDSGNSKSTAVSHDHTTKNYGNSYDTTSSYEYNHDTTTSYEHNYYTTESYNQYDTTTTYNGVYYTTTTTSTAAYSNMTPPPYYNASNVTVTYDSETTLTNFVTETSEVDETMTVFETMTVTSDLSYTTVVYESVQTLVTISQFVSSCFYTLPSCPDNLPVSPINRDHVHRDRDDKPECFNHCHRTTVYNANGAWDSPFCIYVLVHSKYWIAEHNYRTSSIHWCWRPTVECQGRRCYVRCGTRWSSCLVIIISREKCWRGFSFDLTIVDLSGRL